MKIFVAIVLLFATFLVWFVYGSAQAERRARFIEMKNDLKEAHLEFQKYGAFTNYFRTTNVYPFTNQFVIDGAPYQCEFAAQKDDFKERGLLSITTGESFVWIDRKHGLIRLVRPSEFPPGL